MFATLAPRLSRRLASILFLAGLILAAPAAAAGPNRPTAAPGQRGNSSVRSDAIEVLFRAGVTPDQMQALAARLGNPLIPVEATAPDSRIRSISIRSNAAQALRQWSRQAEVEAAELSPIPQIMRVPNDPAYPGLSQYFLPAIQASANACNCGWDSLGTGNAGTIIAIIDTGIDVSHPDFAGRLIVGSYSSLIAGEGVDDKVGHGTHVAGIAAAKGDNHLGGAGVCWDCSIMPIKAISAGGSATWGAIANSIIFVAAHGAKVINLSLGAPVGAYDPIMEYAVSTATGMGALVVAAAGNSNINIGAPNYIYPAYAADAYTVASLDAAGHKSAFSNFGSKINIAAPGEDICSTRPQYAVTGDPQFRPCFISDPLVATLSGTSMAAPQVAGAAALLVSQGFSAAQARAALNAAAICPSDVLGSGASVACPNPYAGVGLLQIPCNVTPPATQAPTVSATPTWTPIWTVSATATSTASPTSSPTMTPSQTPTATPTELASETCTGCEAYCETWENGNGALSRWSATNTTLSIGAYSYGGQSLQMAMPAGGWGTALLSGYSSADPDMEAEVAAPQAGFLLTNVSGGMIDGLWCADCYQLAVNPSFSPVEVKLRKIHGATNSSVEIGSGAGPASLPLASYRIRLAKTGSALSVYVDGALIFTVNDPAPLGAGQVGLQVGLPSPGTGLYDRIVVDPLQCQRTPTTTATSSATATASPTATATPECTGCEAYCQTFEGGSAALGPWTATNTTLSVGAYPYGSLGMDMAMPAGGWGTALLGGFMQADYDLSADVPSPQAGYMITNVTGGMLDGIWCADCYQLAVNPGFSPVSVALRHFKGTTHTYTDLAIGSGPASFPLHSYRMRMTKVGAQIDIYLDGALVLSYTDPTPLGAGQMGLQTGLPSPGTGHYDHVVLDPQRCLLSPTPSASSTATVTATSSASPSASPTATPSQTASLTPSRTDTASSTATATATASPTASATPECTGCEAYCQTFEGGSAALGPWTGTGTTLAVGPYPYGGSGLDLPMPAGGWGSALLGGFYQADYDYAVDVPSPQAGYLLGNVTGGMVDGLYCGDCYQLAVNPGFSPVSVALRHVHGATHSSVDLAITSGPASFPLHSYRVRLRKLGAQIDAFIDGALVLSYTDPTPLGAGQLGLQTGLPSPGTGHYDHVVLDPQRCLYTATPTPTATATPACTGCELYCQSWESGSGALAPWTGIDTALSVGAYPYGGQALHMPMPSGGWGAALLGGISLADVDMEAQVPSPQAGFLLTNISGGMLSGLYCGDCYQLAVNPSFSPVEVKLRKVHGATASSVEIGSGVGPASFPLHSYRIRLVKVGGLLQAYVDGALVISVTDASPLGAGQVGLQTGLAAPGIGEYDRVVINPQQCQASPTPSATATVTGTATPTPSGTGSPSATRTASPSATASASPSATPSASPTGTPSGSPTFTRTATATATASATRSDTPTASPSATGSPSSTSTSTGSATPSQSPTLTATPSASPSATASPSPSGTPTASPTATATPECTGCEAYCQTWEQGSSALGPWTATDTTLAVGAYPYGGLGLQMAMPAGGWGAAVLGGPAYADVDAEVAVAGPQAGFLLTNVSGGMLSGLYCADCYQLAVNPSFSPVDIKLRKVHGATASSVDIGSAAGPVSFPPHSYRIRLVKVGSQLKAYLDGVLVISVSDPSPLGAGQVGLQVGLPSPGTGQYDRLVINPQQCLYTPTLTATRTVTATGTASATASASATMTPTATPTASPIPTECWNTEIFSNGIAADEQTYLSAWAGPHPAATPPPISGIQWNEVGYATAADPEWLIAKCGAVDNAAATAGAPLSVARPIGSFCNAPFVADWVQPGQGSTVYQDKDVWFLRREIHLPAGTSVKSAKFWFSVDNGATVSVDGNTLDMTGITQDWATVTGPVDLISLFAPGGEHVLAIRVDNQHDGHTSALNYRLDLSYCSPAGAVTPTPTPAPYCDGCALFCDTFDQPSNSVTQGRWLSSNANTSLDYEADNFASKALRMDLAGGSVVGESALNGLATADMDVVATVKGIGGTVALDARVRGLPSGGTCQDCYRLAVDIDDGVIGLGKVVGGIGTPLLTLPMPAGLSIHDMVLRLRVVGDQIEGWINGTHLGPVTDSSVSGAGTVGVFSYGYPYWIDSIKVNPDACRNNGGVAPAGFSIKETPTPTPAVSASLTAAPNPFSGSALTVGLSSPLAGTVTLTLSDISGATVWTGSLEAVVGSNIGRYDIGTIATGVYFLQAQLHGTDGNLSFPIFKLASVN